MRRLLDDMNPTLRGLLLIGVVALVVVLLSLEAALVSLFLLVQIAFFLALAFVAYLLWRERRGEIGTWPTRAQAAFYGAIGVAVADLGAYFWPGRRTAGLDALAFVVTLALCGFSAWRVWRDQTSY